MQEAVTLKFLSIRLNEADHKIIATYKPEGDVEKITPDALKQAIFAAGFAGYNLFESVLLDAVGKYNFREAFEMPVGEALDGQVTIRVESDRMSAYLTITQPLGGASAQMENVLSEAASKGVTVELDQDAIAQGLREGCSNVLIAQGRLAVNGTDGKVENFVPTLSTRTPRLDEHGMADFRELGDIVTVHIGDVLLRHIPATSGEPGITVTGQPIPALAGKDVPFATKLDGTMLDPNDPNTLVAAINGCPVLTKSDVSVEPVYSVKDVDLHVGNVTFDGSVHVTGDVHAGMTVRASGDIHIDGTAECAILDAGGDIVVKGGILGHEGQDGPAGFPIKCKGSCTAKFVQNGHISAGHGIFIHEFTMQSELVAEQQIIVGTQGGHRGDIIGGVSRAGMLVKAHAIGSHSNMHTVIFAGADKAQHERLLAAAKEREAAEHKLTDIIRLLQVAAANPGRIPQEAIQSATATRDAGNAEIEALQAEEIELRRQIDLAHDAKVIADKQVFAGVEVCFGPKHYNLVTDRQGGSFFLKDGELVFE